MKNIFSAEYMDRSKTAAVGCRNQLDILKGFKKVIPLWLVRLQISR